MCRLALKTASKPFSPFTVLTAMEAMQEGYDGSGLGLILRGVKFADFTYRAQDPILSAITHTEAAYHRLDAFMQEKGFQLKYDHEFEVDFTKIEAQDRYKYILRVYKLPESWKSFDAEELERQMMLTRLELRKNGEDHGGDLTVFSFWPLRSFSSVDLTFRHVAKLIMRERIITATVIILNFRLLNILLL